MRSRTKKQRYTSIKFRTEDHLAFKRMANKRFGGATLMDTISTARRLLERLEKADPDNVVGALREVREEGMQLAPSDAA